MRISVNELDRVIDQTVRPHAVRVDASGEFPKASLDALAASGVMGLPMAESVGGGGGELADAVTVIRTLAGACGSTAMIVLMHYTAATVIDRHGPDEVKKAIAAGEHLSTLAFSESGSRSQFWVPLGTATASVSGRVCLDADKSWITAAGEADSYVWSSRPLAADAAGPMTLWLVPAGAAGLSAAGAFDGLGLRGNASAPLTADGVLLPLSAMLGADGGGLDLALASILPCFLICSAAMSAGLIRRLATETAGHLQRTRLAHLGVSLAQQAGPRAQLARLQIEADRTWAHISDALSAVEDGRPDATLLVLEVKAAAGEAAAEAADLALRAGGGAAFRKESVVERLFRDSQAARVMAPTTDALHDFVGRALCGLPLLGDVA